MTEIETSTGGITTETATDRGMTGLHLRLGTTALGEDPHFPEVVDLTMARMVEDMPTIGRTEGTIEIDLDTKGKLIYNLNHF